MSKLKNPYNTKINRIRQKMQNVLEISSRSSYLPLTLRKHLKKGRPVYLIDVGAHQGHFTRSIEKHCGIVKAALIEPLPDKAEYLRQTFRSSRYQIFEAVISNQNSQIEFEINEYDQTSSILSIHRDMHELSKIKLNCQRKIFCSSFTLDKILDKIQFPYVDLLKVDVQGVEHLVIEGASKTLKNTSMIWIEISFKPLYKGSSTFFNIYQDLTKKGFRLIEIEPGFRSPDGELLQGDAFFYNDKLQEFT